MVNIGDTVIIRSEVGYYQTSHGMGMFDMSSLKFRAKQAKICDTFYPYSIVYTQLKKRHFREYPTDYMYLGF